MAKIRGQYSRLIMSPYVLDLTQVTMKPEETGQVYYESGQPRQLNKLELIRPLSKIVPGRKCKVCKQKAVIEVGFDGWRKRCTFCHWSNF